MIFLISSTSFDFLSSSISSAIRLNDGYIVKPLFYTDKLKLGKVLPLHFVKSIVKQALNHQTVRAKNLIKIAAISCNVNDGFHITSKLSGAKGA